MRPATRSKPKPGHSSDSRDSAAPQWRPDQRRLDRSPRARAARRSSSMSATRSMLGQPSSRIVREHGDAQPASSPASAAPQRNPDARRATTGHAKPFAHPRDAPRPPGRRAPRRLDSSRSIARGPRRRHRLPRRGRPRHRSRGNLAAVGWRRTGTPHAIASISIRPNCSRQSRRRPARRAQQIHRVQVRRHVVVRHAGGDAARDRVPQRADVSSDDCSAPPPTKSARQRHRRLRARRCSSIASPFSSTKRPEESDDRIVQSPAQASAHRATCDRIGPERRIVDAGVDHARGLAGVAGPRRAAFRGRSAPNAIHPSARRITRALDRCRTAAG